MPLCGFSEWEMGKVSVLYARELKHRNRTDAKLKCFYNIYKVQNALNNSKANVTMTATKHKKYKRNKVNTMTGRVERQENCGPQWETLEGCFSNLNKIEFN